MKAEKNETAPPTIWRAVGYCIKTFREDLDLTQAEFLERFGKDAKRSAYTSLNAPAIVSPWERGDTSPPAALLFNIWRAGYSVDQLFAVSGRRAAVKRGLNDAHVLDAIGDSIDSGQEAAGYSQESNAKAANGLAAKGIVDLRPRRIKRNRRNVR